MLNPARKAAKIGYRIHEHTGTCGRKSIPGRALQSHVWPSRKAAKTEWYDSCPGRNDRMTLVKVAMDERSAAVNTYYRRIKGCNDAALIDQFGRDLAEQLAALAQ